MSNEKMYKQRKANIAVFRGCDFNCVYCAFRNTLSRLNCTSCGHFTPHSHLETLSHRPSKTRDGEFVTIGLTGDISFMNPVEFKKIIDYCHEWCNVTFLIQSKNPIYFLQFVKDIPDNVIIGTTIESNLGQWWSKGYEPIYYSNISKAPNPINRFEAMLKISCRRAITIEPVLDFNADTFSSWVINIQPEIVWLGYDSKPERNHLPEPPLAKTQEFIKRLEDAGILVHRKLIREAWYWPCGY
jgi:DNA repair photolyase